MSNNGNILSGLFRSISRRGQRRAEESDSPSHADVNMEPQSSPTSTLVDQPTPNTAVINSVNADDGIQSDSSMPPLQAVSDSDGDDSGSEDEGEDIQRGNFMDTADSFHSGDIILHPDEDEDMPPLPIRPSPFANMRSQGTRRARVEDDGDGDSERDRRHPSQRALHNQSEPDPIRPLHPPQTNEHVHRHIVFSNFAGGAPGVGAGAAGPLPPNPHHRAHPQHPFPVHLMAQMGFDAHSNTTQNGNPEFSNNGSQGNNTNTPVGAPPQDHQNQQPHGAMPHTPNSFAAILQSLFQAAGSQPGAAFTTALNGVPIGDNEPHAGATNGGNSGFLGNLFTAMEGGMEGNVPSSFESLIFILDNRCFYVQYEYSWRASFLWFPAGPRT
ncbi:hypothetical protein J3R30DRAFT_2848453 [Lentinula aciculospora]|uniref:Uncharacterized protein n=1 Tax=Lentinula aciculospora TaxID=153920 RepID=A0A9W9DNJ8_9AGAR|nr:hypothetical protein J3R30DRAFT_2848453 [Lentinula aciculospora]